MLEDVTRSPVRADNEVGSATAVLCPCDRVLADVRLSLLGIRLPLAVLGDHEAGEPPAAGRIRIPASPDEIAAALVAGEVVIGERDSTPVGSLTDLAVASAPDAGWIEGRLFAAQPEAVTLQVRESESRVVVVAERPIAEPDLEHVRGLAVDEVVLVLPLVSTSPDGLPSAVLSRCLEQVAPADFTRLGLPVSWRGTSVDEAIARAITTALDGTHLYRIRSAAESRVDPAAPPGDLLWADALDRLHQASISPAVSSDPLLAEVLPVLTRWRPPRQQRGLVVFFTGLSGSGKSSLARALTDHLADQADRNVTLLDGDVVRRMLSSGLGFDRAGRDLNVRRIGFVAAEVARHGGIAVCAPIAPYAESRAAVREMVESVGDLVLVHVATPLAECERRDVKGLYRKARAGVVTQFTGISDPYDEPLDAEVRVNTAGVSLAESLAVITDYLAEGGWLPKSAAVDEISGG